MNEERVRLHCRCKQCRKRFWAWKDETVKCPKCGSEDYQVIIE